MGFIFVVFLVVSLWLVPVTYGGTFRVHSSTAGFDVWSTLTHRGFHIDRDSMWRL